MSNYLKEDLKQRHDVLKTLGIEENDIKRDVEIIKTWMTQQPHLPQNDIEDENFIERMLIGTKFNIEQAKIKLDNYYSLRCINHNMYEDLGKIAPSKLAWVQIPTRILDKNKRRIVLMGRNPNSGTRGFFLDNIRNSITSSELLTHYGYFTSVIGIFDLKGFSLSVFENLDMNLLYKTTKLFKLCYAGRIAKLHIINASSLETLLLSLIKSLLGEKVKIHKDLESLQSYVPKEQLPKDYGGSDLSIKEYLDLWDKIVKEEEPLLSKIPTVIPNESLRVGKCELDEDVFGVNGTFKQINLD